MSFSGDAKAELCKIPVQKLCCSRAEAYGALLYCNTFSASEIRVVTESRAFAQRLPRLFHRAFGVDFDACPSDAEKPGKLVFAITSGEKMERILAAFGLGGEPNLALHINYGILEEECCRTSFVRGAFLAGGSVTDPGKRYHLEFATSHYKVSREICALMLDMGFQPKNTVRKGNYVTYFKQSEHIEDLLTKLGAPVAAMDIMSAKVEKDLRNEMNRRVNCDSANIGKAVDAAMEQLECIRRLESSGRLEKLPDKLRETARLRLENPDLTLSQLSECFSPAITKSCLNHRLRKLAALARQESGI
jgi:DNA-binding protein WhiA